jgi:acetyl esterase/lipase
MPSKLKFVSLLAIFVAGFHQDDAKSQTPEKQSSAARQSATQKAPAKKKTEQPAPKPTLESVSYGPHPKQVISFWKAESPTPTPLLFFIHGGGWQGGNRMSGMSGWVPAMHRAGISVVSIEYRFIEEAIADGVQPPVKACLHDAARALQFVRSKAAEWNIDKTRIAAAGGSAGACTSLWLAFHDDLADPNSSDPVARESTRLLCAAVSGAQTTLDPRQMKEWMPNSNYGSHAFGIFREVDGKKQRDFDAFLARRDEIMPWIEEYSPFHLASAGDPPVHLTYNKVPKKGEVSQDPTHSACFGLLLKEKLDSLKVPCELVWPGAENVTYRTSMDYVIAKLQGR